MLTYDNHVHVFGHELLPKQFFWRRFRVKTDSVDDLIEAFHETPLDDLIEWTGDVLDRPLRLDTFLDYFLGSYEDSLKQINEDLKPYVGGAAVLNIDFFDRPWTEFKKLWDKQFDYDIFDPFVGIDPRRKKAVEYVSIALSEEYMGIKLYPGVGWNPLEHMAVLTEIAKIAADYNVPIVIHCSKGGYKGETHVMMNNHPGNWIWILERVPEVTLVLAHGGGNSHFISKWNSNDVEMTNWNEWVSIMAESQGYNLYMDVAYHESAVLESRKYEKAFKKARKHLKERIVYGSDWPLISICCEYGEYYQKFNKFFNS